MNSAIDQPKKKRNLKKRSRSRYTNQPLMHICKILSICSVLVDKPEELMDNSQQESVFFPLWRNSRNSECGLLLFCITLQQKILVPPWPIAGKIEWLFETFSFLGLTYYLNSCCHLQKHGKKENDYLKLFLFWGWNITLTLVVTYKNMVKKKERKWLLPRTFASDNTKYIKNAQFYTFKLWNHPY